MAMFQEILVAVLLLVTVVNCQQRPGSSERHQPDYDDPIWNFPFGDDIAGPYCENRRGDRCCYGRNDRCAVPILDTLCYCDQFCNRTTSIDCCPDYFENCLGISGLEGRPPSIIRPPGSGIDTGDSTHIVANQCTKDDRTYKQNDVLRNNCNNCTCSLVTYPTRSVLEWQCTNVPCMVEPSILDHVQRQNPGWRAANYSSMWGQTLEQGMQYKLGTFRPLNAVKEMTSLRSRVDDRVFPENFDARTKWPNLIHPVQDQGQCGASWAFSTAGVASDRLSIHSKGHHVDQLSPQHLISCDVDVLQRACQGGHIDRAWWFIRVNGVVNSACYPYRSGQTGEKEACLLPFYDSNCPNGDHENRHFKATPPYRISSKEKDIMHEIMKNGPVQATLDVKEDLFIYRSGVYRYSAPPLPPSKAQPTTGHHSVRIIGWGVEASTGTKYWLCANSWGTQWGEAGYFRILRGENECGIESFVLAAWAKVTADGKSRIQGDQQKLLRRRYK